MLILKDHFDETIEANIAMNRNFRGSIATQLRDAPAFGIYFASYDYMARHFSKDGTMESLTSVQLLIAGGLLHIL